MLAIIIDMVKNKCEQCDIVMDSRRKDRKCNTCKTRPTIQKYECAYCQSEINHDKYELKTYGNCCKKCNSVFVRKLKVKRAIKSMRLSQAPQEVLDDLDYQYNLLTNDILKRRLYNELKNKSIDLSSYLDRLGTLLD